MAHGRRAGHETTQRRARRLRSWLPALACCTVVAATCAAPASAAGPAWTGFTELSPTDAHPDAPDAVVESVACAGSASCAAVGSYTDADGFDQAMAASRAGGDWSVSEPGLPGNANSSYPEPSLLSVACGAPGSCSAVGVYTGDAGVTRAMVTSRSSGAWLGAEEAPLPPDANPSLGSDLSAVACGGAGSCSAVGSYKDNGGVSRLMIVTLAHGTWSAEKIDPPAGAVEANLLSVACGAVGSCATVGFYGDGSGAVRPMAATQSGGDWTAAAIDVALPLDANPAAPNGYLISLACGGAGSCVAGGSYSDDKTPTSASHAIFTSLANGSWSRAAVLPLPSDANDTDPAASVDALGCGAPGSCGAVGTYTDGSGTPRTMVASQVSESWAPAARLELPADAAPDVAASDETSIACADAGACVLAGSYVDASTQRPMVASQVNGTWSAASALGLPSDAHANPDAVATSVACGAPSSCLVGGFYNGPSGSRRAMVASLDPQETAPPTSTPPAPAATPAPVTTAPSAALQPIVVLKTSKFTVSKGAIKVKLGCRTAHCSGTVKLTTTAKRKTVVLAKASYALVRGRTATISVRLTKAGRKALKHSRARAVRAKLVISIKGGRSTSRTVAVR
jgi:hypothetical protein